MKVLALILSLYVTALALVPCSDGAMQNIADVEVELSIDNDCHDHSDHEDDCGPFCICACCGTVLTLPAAQHIEEHKIVSVPYFYSLIESNYSFAYSQGIWHPPRVS